MNEPISPNDGPLRLIVAVETGILRDALSNAVADLPI
jgi:hypothetical protein